MTDEFKDRRLKYVELPKIFQSRVSEIDIASKQHLRSCERVAGFLSKQHPKTPKEFEQIEWLKDFVLKTAGLNIKTIELLDYLRHEIEQVSQDAEILIEGALTIGIINDQEQSIKAIQEVRDKAIKEIYDIRKSQLRADTPAIN